MNKEMDDYLNGLKTALRDLNICKGDILYVSSDVTQALFNAKEKFGLRGRSEKNLFLDKMVDALKETVGDTGTLLFPVFSWAFCKGKGFDYYETPGEVGAFSNFVLKNRKDFKRTRHPLYSFMVCGKYKDELVNMSNQDAWGEASPFFFFRTHKAKQLLFNIEAFQGLTFCHYVEQCAKVPYRHLKYFFGKYCDANGYVETRMYSMYVRDMDVMQEVCVTNEFLIKNGVAVLTEWDKNQLTVVDLNEAYPVLLKDIKENLGKNTLKFENYEFDLKKEQTVPYEIGKIPVE